MEIQRRSIRSPIQLAPAPQPKLGDSIDSIVQLVRELEGYRDQLPALIENAHAELARAKEVQKGDQGEKGESVYTPEDLEPHIQRVAQMVFDRMPMPEDGKDGKDGMPGAKPVFGKDYMTQAHQAQIVQQVAERFRQPEDGKTPDIDHTAIASDVIAQIVSGKLLKAGHIDGLEQTMTSYRSQLARGDGYVHGGGDTVKAGTNVTLTRNPDGTTSINATGGGGGGTAVYGEVVTGSGTSWTLANAPTAGTLRLYANGQRLTLTVDYTLSGTAITTLTSWAAGTLLADYNH